MVNCWRIPRLSRLCSFAALAGSTEGRTLAAFCGRVGGIRSILGCDTVFHSPAKRSGSSQLETSSTESQYGQDFHEHNTARIILGEGLGRARESCASSALVGGIT